MLRLLITLLFVTFSISSLASDGVTVSYTVERGRKEFTLPTGDPIMVGDEIKVNFTASQNGYLYLFSIGPEGDVYLLVPSTTSNTNQLHAGNQFSFGPFPVVPPTGLETLYFLTASMPVSSLSLKVEGNRFADYMKDGGAVENFVWALNGAEYRGISTSTTRGIGRWNTTRCRRTTTAT